MRHLRRFRIRLRRVALRARWPFLLPNRRGICSIVIVVSWRFGKREQAPALQKRLSLVTMLKGKEAAGGGAVRRCRATSSTLHQIKALPRAARSGRRSAAGETPALPPKGSILACQFEADKLRRAAGEGAGRDMRGRMCSPGQEDPPASRRRGRPSRSCHPEVAKIGAEI